MNIGIIFGGDSHESEVSKNSGLAISQACKSLGYQTTNYLLETNSIDNEINSLKKHDFVFIALHGTFGEDGALQKILEQNNIKYNGSDQFASKKCFNKSFCKEIAINDGIITPDFYVVESNICNDNIGFSSSKYVIKPNSQGSSVGFKVIDNYEKINEAIDNALDFDTKVLIEEYIGGAEITVPILGDEVLPVIEIIPKKGFYDYSSKYTKGMSEYVCPADIGTKLTSEIKDTAQRIHQLLGCEVYSRVDFKIYNDEVFFLEINTLPGMTETSLFPMSANKHGYSFKDLIDKIIKLSQKK